MRLHPSVFQQARRLWLFVPVAGALALVTNLLSLSGDAFPGYSAALVAEAAGLLPPSEAAHPLFALLARQVAAAEVLTLTVRLNLFSALCGTLCAMLLCSLVGKLILFSACEDGGGGERNELMEDLDAVPPLQPEVEAHNRRIFKIAVSGGLLAAFLLTFLVPTWMSATRLENGSFNLLLALAALSLYPFKYASAKLARLFLSSFLFVLCACESATFLVLSPLVAYLVFMDFVRSPRRDVLVGVVVAAMMAGSLLAGYALLRNTGTLAAATPWALGAALARRMAHHHWSELHALFPKSGWLLVVIQVGIPALILFFGQQLLFKERRPNSLVAVLLVALAAVPSLLNLSISPFFLYQPLGRLPVFGTALLAAALGCVVASCLVFLSPDDQSADADLSVKLDYTVQRRMNALKGVSVGLLPCILLLTVATPLRSLRSVSARQGAYADQMAREILETMRGQSCLITSGLLDNHLLVQARMLGRPLTLVAMRSRAHEKEIGAVRRFIEASPIFEGMNRQRLLNALSIGPARFVTEWFNTDKDAGRYAMVLATPDLWTACGYVAVPEGLAFGGARAGVTIDTRRLVEQHRAFADRAGACLARQAPEYGRVAGLRALLRMKAGFAANELGVLLEENGAMEEAYAAYARATALDPANVSAAVNAYALTSLRGLHPEAGEALKKRMRNALENAQVKGARDVTWVLQNHGTIRQQAFYSQQSAMWASLGVRSVATAKIRKAQTLAERTGTAALLDNAAVYLQAGDTTKAEGCFLAALERDAANRDALIGMCTLMLGKQQAKDAEKWLKRAAEAGVEPLALSYQSATLAILKSETEQALSLLETATRESPGDLRQWALLADLLLSRGDTQRVERQLLPDMQAALKSADHYLVHAIRGMCLRRKGGGFFREARLSLLSALALNAELPDIWNELLELDLAIGNAAFTETDARKALGIDPDHAFANFLLGSLKLSRGALPESEDFLRRSLEKRPTAAANNDLAENLRQQKRLPEAEAAVRRALEMEPGLAPAQDTLACVFNDMGRFGEAEQGAQKLVSEQPNCPAYQLTLLRAKVGLGKKAEVDRLLKDLEQAKFAIPDSVKKQIAAMK